MKHLWSIIIASILLTSCTAPLETDGSGVTLLDGTPVTVDELIKNSSAIITFWHSTCSFCKEELPLFQEIAYEMPELTFVGVNLQESSEVAEKYWNDGGYSFETLLDPKKNLVSRFEVFTKPTTFFVRADGVIDSHKNGPLGELELRQRISDMLGGKPDERLDVLIQEQLSGEVIPVDDVQFSSTPGLLRSWYGDEVLHTIPFDEVLSGGPPKDGIPSIDKPSFESVDDTGYLNESDRGLLLTVGSETRFYPFAILNWHEIVNDDVGGKKVAVTYCPLCDTAVVYERLTKNGYSTFGVSGLLYQSNMLMYDRNTETLWNQATGRGVVGPLTGEKVTLIPSDIVTWKTVLSHYSDADVLSRSTGVLRDYDRSPYEGYMENEEIVFPVREENTELHPKEQVIGLVLDGQAVAYVRSELVEQGYIEDSVEGVDIEITYDKDREAIRAMRLDTSEPLDVLPVFWFAWLAQYPRTILKK